MRSVWQDPIGRHVAIVIAVKLGLLAILWCAFVRDASLNPGGAEVGAAILGTAPHATEQAKEGER